MGERPILFNGPMVRSILDGRKTQTRRLVKPGMTVWEGFDEDDCEHFFQSDDRFGEKLLELVRWPYGGPGDRLWVRETWGLRAPFDMTDWYRGPVAGKHALVGRELDYRADWQRPDSEQFWRPSIHMPRWAARLFLEVTEVRVQRLQDITEADAKAEGCELLGDTIGPEQAIAGDSRRRRHEDHPHTLALAVLWDTINGDRSGASWASNPWVWCVSFRSVEASHG